MANIAGTYVDITGASEDALSARFVITGTDASYIYAFEIDGGTAYNDSFTSPTINVSYWLEIERDEAIGTYGTFYVRIYSDSARTTLVDTLSITLHTSKKDYEYLYGAQSLDASGAGVLTSYVQDLDLQEGGLSIPIAMYHYAHHLGSMT